MEWGNIINSGWCSVATLPRQCVQVSRKIRESAKKRNVEFGVARV